MIIGVDARALVAPITGIGQYLKSILEAWPNSSDKLILYSPSPLDPELHFHVPHRVSLYAGLPVMLWKETVLPTQARRDGIDIFWGPQFVRPLILRVPSAITIHDSFWLKPSSQVRMGIKRRLGNQLLIPPSIRSAHTVMVISAEAMGDLQVRYPRYAKKFVHVPLGATWNCPPLEIPPLKDVPRLLLVGTIEPKKHVPFMAETIRRINKDHIRVYLDIVGSWGWESKKYWPLIAKSQQYGINYHGYVANDTLQALYAKTDFLVSASNSEGTGIPFLFALGLGIPVIARDIPAVNQLSQVSRAVHYIESNDTDKWKLSIEHCLMNRLELRQLALKSALTVRAQHSLRRMAQRTWALLKEAAQA